MRNQRDVKTFFSNNWKEIIVFLALAPILYKFIINQLANAELATEEVKDKKNNAENVKGNPLTQEQKINKILSVYKFSSTASRRKVIKAAEDLPHHLGVQYFKEGSFLGIPYELPLSVRALTENDIEVEKILLANPNNFHIIEKLYYSVFTPSRNLKADILKYLDKSSIETVRKAWAKSNQYL